MENLEFGSVVRELYDECKEYESVFNYISYIPPDLLMIKADDIALSCDNLEFVKIWKKYRSEYPDSRLHNTQLNIEAIGFLNCLFYMFNSGNPYVAISLELSRRFKILSRQI